MDPQSARQLWRRVLLQVVRDAISLARIKDGNAKRVRSDALSWLEGDSRDFVHVCTLAGYEPDIIREWWASIKHDQTKVAAAARRLRETNRGAEAKRKFIGSEE